MHEVTLIMSCSETFTNYMLTALWSVMEHLEQGAQVRFFLLHCDISEQTRTRLSDALCSWERLEVNFIDIMPFAAKYGYSKADVRDFPTCFPLLACEVLPQVDKAICLDSDLIVKRDLTVLWDVSLGDHLIAAALDADFNGQFHSGNHKYLTYYKRIVTLKNPHDYIQAGVVIYNLAAMRETFRPGALFSAAICGKYQFDDQDVLNLFCEGRILHLDMRWNVLHDNLNDRISCVISLAQEAVKEEYLRAREDPWIIHYAGCQKPWDDKDCDFADEFWQIARETPVYEMMEQRYSSVDRSDLRKMNSLVRRKARYLRFLFRKMRLKWKALQLSL